MKKIVLSPHTPAWETTYERLRTVYLRRLDGLITDIQHVGSTAIPGIKAKPIIDIDIIIADRARLPVIISRLGELGYTHEGDWGITGREAFSRDSDKVPLTGTGEGWPDHHLYVCDGNAISLKNHLQFRDYLLRHPEEAQEYSRLKEDLARRFPYDIDQYVMHKTGFITRILQKLGFDDTDLDNITQQNKAPL